MQQSIGRRRWFQLSLTSLFIMLTVAAVWSAWQVRVIHERQAWLAEHPGLAEIRESAQSVPNITIHGNVNLDRFNTLFTRPTPTIPRWRRWLGDVPVACIFDPGFTYEERARAAELFPEATIGDPLAPAGSYDPARPIVTVENGK